MARQNKKNEVLEAALKVFAEYGYKKSTVEDIAAKLDLTKGALYQYAKDKKDLYDQAVKNGLLKWQNKVLTAVKKVEDPQIQFKILCKNAFKYLAEDATLKSVMIKDPDIFPLSFNSDPYKEINVGSMNLLKSIIDNGIMQGKFKAIDTELITRLMFSIYKMLIIETYVLGENPDAMLDAVIDLITLGFYTA